MIPLLPGYWLSTRNAQSALWKSALAKSTRNQPELRTYTARYTKLKRGYVGQLVEWPEVVTEGKTLEECRKMLEDALREMVAAYREQNREIPLGKALLEQIAVEV